MTLVEPEITAQRGSFHDSYLSQKSDPYRHGKAPRLLDCLLVIVPTNDPDYFNAPEAGEFAVVDVVTKEKAFFDMPYGATPDTITGMVSQHFAATAFRVGDKLWFV